MISIPTENGMLEIEEAELKAARVSTVWNAYERTLQVVITWHDNGQPGFPEIVVENNVAHVNVRPEAQQSIAALLKQHEKFLSEEEDD